MNEIYMDHPANGSMVVYNLAEQAEWEKKGWKRRVPQPWEKPAAKKSEKPEKPAKE